MKKIVLAAALLLTSVATFAQHEVGDLPFSLRLV